MSTSCADYVLPSNPDISGIGVRSAIYIQSLICIISGVLAIADGVVTEDELPFLEEQALAADILGFAILVAGFAQALTFGLTPYHASIVLSLAFLSTTTVAFVNSVRRSSRKPTFLNLQQAREKLGLESFAPLEHKMNFDRPGVILWINMLVRGWNTWRRTKTKDRYYPQTAWYLITLQPHLIYSWLRAIMLMSLSFWLWSDPLAFGNGDHNAVECVASSFVLGKLPLSSKDLQMFSLCLSSLFALVCVINSISLIPNARTATSYSQWTMRRRRSMPPQSRVNFKPSSSSLLGRQISFVMKRDLIFLFIMFAYTLGSIIQIEKTVRANRHLQDSEEAHWTFGQTLAIIMLIPAIRGTIKYAWFSPLKKARRVKQTKLLEADITNGEMQNFVSRVNQGADPNVVVASDSNQQYASALQAAAASGELLIVSQLLNRKADVNLRVEDRPWATALQAASFHGQLEIVILLLKAGADPNIKGGMYGTALQAAAYSGDLEIVRRLLKGNANPELEGGKYGTALQAASHRGHQQVVNLLLLDPNKGLGNTAPRFRQRRAILDKARNNTSPDTRGELEAIFSTPSSTYDVATVLLNGKASPNLEGGEFGSALQAACYYAAADIVGLLLQKGANPNISAGKLGSPLSICRRRREEMQGFERLVREYETIEALLLRGSEEAQPSR